MVHLSFHVTTIGLIMMFIVAMRTKMKNMISLGNI